MDNKIISFASDIRRININLLEKISLENRRSLPNCPAIYFVFGDDTLIYIGQTGKKKGGLVLRWQSHDLLKVKAFYSDIFISWLQCDCIDSLDALEESFISLYKPLYNHISKYKEVPKLNYNFLFNYLSQQGWHRLNELFESSRIAARVYGVLSTRTDHHAAIAISQQDIGKLLNVTTRSIHTGTKYLVENKIIYRVRLDNGNFVYCFNPDEIWKFLDVNKQNSLFYLMKKTEDEDKDNLKVIEKIKLLYKSNVTVI